MKLLKKSAIWIIVLLYMVLAFSFVSSRSSEQLCNRLEVSIVDSLNTNFLTSDDVIAILQRNEIGYLGIPLDMLNLDIIEEAIYSNQIVKTCKVYSRVDGSLKVDITQREPYVRIIESTGKGYYLDKDGNVLNLNDRFTPHVLVINGNIRSSIRVGQAANVLTLEKYTGGELLKELHLLSTYINSHTLWRSQIVQVYVNTSGEYELIPRVGPHIIILGSIDNYQEKFDKLETFYKEGLNNMGWNQYLKINLKYKDQVVCTKI